MIKHGEINPLNVHGMRRLTHCPPHFTTLELPLSQYNTKVLSDWIYENLVGRFYLGVIDTKIDNRYDRKHQIGFEIASESSYFSLYLSQIPSTTGLF